MSLSKVVDSIWEESSGYFTNIVREGTSLHQNRRISTTTANQPKKNADIESQISPYFMASESFPNTFYVVRKLTRTKLFKKFKFHLHHYTTAVDNWS